MENEEIEPVNGNVRSLLPAEIEDLKSSIKHFIRNNPLDESKYHLWELYKWWAKDNEAATKQDIVDMMLAYDACRTLMEDIYALFYNNKSEEVKI